MIDASCSGCSGSAQRCSRVKPRANFRPKKSRRFAKEKGGRERPPSLLQLGCGYWFACPPPALTGEEPSRCSHQYCVASFFGVGHTWSSVSPSHISPFFIT